MSNTHYTRTVEELRELAVMFWPSELSEKEAELSVIPMLLETQEKFISILGVEVPSIEALFQVINSSSFPGNLFVKHLVVLADFGGETIKQMHSLFENYFPLGKMVYVWGEQEHTYTFKALPIRSSRGRKKFANLDNKKLGIDGKKLLEKQPLNNLLQDMIAILLFGSVCVSETVAELLMKCEIGSFLGQPDPLQKFIKQRYIFVSRITGGAQSNALGHLAEDFVRDYLQEHLEIEGLEFQKNGSLPGVTDRDPDSETIRPASFDLVVTDGTKYVGIEISFQVTTNSVIERKANQAPARFTQVEQKGYKMAYVIDGAGNFMMRESAVRTLCAHSNCTVAFSRSELDVLCRYLREYFQSNH